MREDVRALLIAAVDAIEVPDGDLGQVVRSGKRRMIARRLAGGLAVMAVGVAGWMTASNLASSDRVTDLPQPANPFQDTRKIDRLLVPTEMIGPSPGGEAGSEADIAEARAIAVGFHALLFRVGYDFDYKGIERVDSSSWRLVFLDGLEPGYVQGSIRGRRSAMEDSLGAIARSQATLEQLGRELREATDRGEQERADDLREDMANERDTIRIEKRNVRDLRKGIARLKRYIDKQTRQGGPFAVRLVVVEQDDALMVNGLRSDSLRSKELKAVLGYSERVEDVDSWGVDYYNARFARRGDGVLFEAQGFWTGPIPTSYEEKCLLELLDKNGEVEWRQRDIHDIWRGAEPSEDRRDGWFIGLGIEEEVFGPNISPRFRCESRW